MIDPTLLWTSYLVDYALDQAGAVASDGAAPEGAAADPVSFANVAIHHGAGRETSALKLAAYDFVVTSYAVVRSEHRGGASRGGGGGSAGGGGAAARRASRSRARPFALDEASPRSSSTSAPRARSGSELDAVRFHTVRAPWH